MAKNRSQEKHFETKLMLPDFRGGHFEEYLPNDFHKFSQKIRDKYVALLGRFDKNIYYWQIRWIYQMKDRKVYDLNFMLHVENHHDGKPDILMERLHYFFAKQKYKEELRFIRALDAHDWKKENSKDVFLMKDPYVKAYKKKWLKSFDETPEWRFLYHGVDIIELGEHLAEFEQKKKNRRKVLKASLKNKTINKHDENVENVDHEDRLKKVSNERLSAYDQVFWSMDGVICTAIVVNFLVSDSSGSTFLEVVFVSFVLVLIMQVVFVPIYFVVRLIFFRSGKPQKK